MPNMELITSVTVGSGGAASVTLPATGTIPQTYTDLKVVMSVRGTANIGAAGFNVEYNGNASGYTMRRLMGDGSAAESGTNSTGQIAVIQGGNATANTFSNYELYIPNYTSANNKSASLDGVNETNATTEYSFLYASLWSNSAAITSIKFTPSSGSIVEGSTFYLYGISNVTSTTKATGGIVSSDGTYWYHMFPYSGTFTPTAAISADVLCIAGGGAGGHSRGGGGGAGGLVYSASQSLTATAYTVTVGAGGASTITDVKNNGNNSNVTGGALSLTAAVAGGGGASMTSSSVGNNGGSGGGGTSGGSVGQATSGQGSNGGSGSGDAPNYGGGGGGGFSAAGGAGSGSAGGAGGNGTNTYSSWAIATQTGANNGYYAGGGVGGTNTVVTPAVAGLGGGGSQIADFGLPGAANTGGGGGSGMNSTRAAYGGAGGSGIVIIRYAI